MEKIRQRLIGEIAIRSGVDITGIDLNGLLRRLRNDAYDVPKPHVFHTPEPSFRVARHSPRELGDDSRTA